MVGLITAVPLPPPKAGIANKSTLIRRGTIRKADDAGLDMDTLSTPPSPAKRLRVTFKEEVEEKVLEAFRPKSKSLDSVRAEVKRSLDGHFKGDSEAYDVLKAIFVAKKDGEEDGEDGEDIRTYLVALTTYASMLNAKCSGLVRTLLAFEWMGRDEPTVKAYIHFLGSLASSQGAFLQAILDMLVQNFTGIKFSSGRLPGCPDVSRVQLMKRVHVALKYLLRLIPSASSVLADVLPRKYPNMEDPRKLHTTYIKNLVAVIEYAPELKSDIFALVTGRVVEIDVSMQVDMDDIDDDMTAAIVEAITMQPHTQLEDRDTDSESDEDLATTDDEVMNNTKRIKVIQAKVEKLDSILDLLFSIYDPYFRDPNSLEAAAMFETLLGHFASIILRNYQSRYTQFILFHFAQTADYLVDQFAGTCVQLSFQTTQPAVFRQSSAAYLASFVARGAHVQPQVVRTVFDLIGNHLDHMRADHELTCRGPDLTRYGTFYAMTQALLYIFCFRWRDLINSSEISEDDDPMGFVAQDLNWTSGIKETLSRTIYSKLNPLKICSPLIVAEFAKISMHLRFMYVYPLLEANKRIRLSQYSSSHTTGALRETGNSGSSESWHQLDTYFPFDPYQLPLSRRWVDDDYVQWRGVPGLVQEEEDDDSEDDEGEEDVDANDDGEGSGSETE